MTEYKDILNVIKVNNLVVLRGNLTKEVRFQVGKKKPYAYLTVAVNRTTGGTDFISVKAWGDLAVNCQENLKTGMRVAIVGRKESSDYKDGTQNDQGKDNYKGNNSITADYVEVLGKSNDAPSGNFVMPE